MKQYLPMGSIVKIKDTKRKTIIVGRLQRRTDSDEIYDYSGLLYPVGSVENKIFLFNEGDISEVIFRGYCDIEEQEFVKFLNSNVEQA